MDAKTDTVAGFAPPNSVKIYVPSYCMSIGWADSGVTSQLQLTVLPLVSPQTPQQYMVSNTIIHAQKERWVFRELCRIRVLRQDNGCGSKRPSAGPNTVATVVQTNNNKLETTDMNSTDYF